MKAIQKRDRNPHSNKTEEMWTSNSTNANSEPSIRYFYDRAAKNDILNLKPYDGEWIDSSAKWCWYRN